MLILGRKINERILIGSDIVITVVRTASGSVHLGIDAPKGIKILRDELSDDQNPKHKYREKPNPLSGVRPIKKR
jgi:carbon storage regulator CsrA